MLRRKLALADSSGSKTLDDTESEFKDVPENHRPEPVNPTQSQIEEKSHEANRDENLTKASNRLAGKVDDAKSLEDFVLGAEQDAVEHLGSRKHLMLKKPDESDADQIESSNKRPARVPVWVDEDDDVEDEASVDLKDSRYRKLAKLGETSISQKEYQQRLKKRYEAVYGARPSWADLDQNDSGKRRYEDEDEEERELSRHTGNYLSKSTHHLPPTYLEYKPVTHANKALLHKTTVSTVRFHPSSQIVMTASKDQNLSFFQVDGEKNAKIQSLHVENFPIYCARFTTDGQQVVLGSRHKAFYNYDMISGT
ncbi:UTP18 [Bugula neritina]|uniref:UTP18 n=1 Tax=Bugula neritina TaxID=10212 RepID=A0A7J7KMH3_BUGNE|nr:UTP18 [Bugula neritina]